MQSRFKLKSGGARGASPPRPPLFEKVVSLNQAGSLTPINRRGFPPYIFGWCWVLRAFGYRAEAR